MGGVRPGAGSAVSGSAVPGTDGSSLHEASLHDCSVETTAPFRSVPSCSVASCSGLPSVPGTAVPDTADPALGRTRAIHGALRSRVDEHVHADPAHLVHLQPRDVGDRSHPRVVQRRRPGPQQRRLKVRQHPVHPVRGDERAGEPRPTLEQHIHHAAIVQRGQHRVSGRRAQVQHVRGAQCEPGLKRRGDPTTTRSGLRSRTDRGPTGGQLRVVHQHRALPTRIASSWPATACTSARLTRR